MACCSICGTWNCSCAEILKSMEWISVKDQLPKIDIDILVSDGQSAFIGSRTNSDELSFHVCQCDTSYNGEIEVTHWMLLPSPPIEDPA